MSEVQSSAAPTVVLVHGGFVDGAGWEGVYKLLRKDGYNVSIVQNPTLTLADDVAATRLVIAQAKGPVVLVGHSYGGVVITEAGNDPKVAKLVYIAAFAPDKGESVAKLIENPPPGAPVPPILPPQDGYQLDHSPIPWSSSLSDRWPPPRLRPVAPRCSNTGRLAISPHEPDLLEDEERRGSDAGQAFFLTRQGVYRSELSEADPATGLERADGHLRRDAELGRREGAKHEFLLRL
ncbi:MAG: alpha/beta hydrolase [Pseudolabrys sp.]